MLTRIAVGLVLLAAVAALLIWAPVWAIVLAVSLFGAMAAIELLWNSGIVTSGRMVVLAAVLAGLVPVWRYFGSPMAAGAAALLLFVLLLFADELTSAVRQGFASICAVCFAAIVVPLLLASLLSFLERPDGRFLVCLPLLAAVGSDTFAYFIGKLLGKTKLAPDISPHKTVAGAFGGLVGGILLCVAFGLVMNETRGWDFSLPLLAGYGLLGSVAGQVGDLSFSLIKRERGLKDFGGIFPGHGGVLDRCDSLLFVAPLFAALFEILPAAGGLQ